MGKKFFRYIGIAFFLSALSFSAFLFYLGHISSYTNVGIDEFLKKAQNFYNVEIRGIIHIGASTGQERNAYKLLGVKDVLWIEADPETYRKLHENLVIQGDSNSIAENFAVSDEDGEAEFFVTNNKYSSSLIDLDLHKSIYPDIGLEKKISVKTKRLDTYFGESDRDIKKYNIIVIDIQGAELMAMKGAVDSLKSIDVILSEVSPDTMYKGSVRIYELDEFLLAQGFVRLDTKMFSPICGDALYVRKDIISRRFQTESK